MGIFNKINFFGQSKARRLKKAVSDEDLFLVGSRNSKVNGNIQDRGIAAKTLKSYFSGVSTFLGLTDTPSSYGLAGDLAVVNDAGDGLKFVAPASGGSGADPAQGLFAKWNGAQYDYYLTLSDAFGTISDGDTLIQLKDFNQVDVTFAGYSIANKTFEWEMNGYEFRHDFDDISVPMITFNNCKVNIRNGKIQKDATVNSSSSGASISADNGTELTLFGVEVAGLRTYKVFLNNQSKLYGGYYTGERGGVYLLNGSLADNLNIDLTNGQGLQAITDCFVSNSRIKGSSGALVLLGGSISNCSVFSTTGIALLVNVGARAINCYGYSSNGRGMTVNGGGEADNCVGESNANIGIFSENGILNNCVGRSQVNWGIVFQKGTIADNCVGFSSSSYGMRNFSTDASRTMRLTNCKSISENFIGGLQNSTSGHSIYHNFSSISLWDNVGGHAFEVSRGASATLEILGGSMEVVNNGANGLFYPNNAVTIDYAKLTFRGMTTAVSASITQGLASVEDAQGNILI